MSYKVNILSIEDAKKQCKNRFYRAVTTNYDGGEDVFTSPRLETLTHALKFSENVVAILEFIEE